MYTLTDCNRTLHALIASSPVASQLRGAIYLEGDRPLRGEANSPFVGTEAINVQTIAIRHGYPQTAESIAVIYVPDKPTEIAGSRQYATDTERIGYLSSLLIRSIREQCIEGVQLSVEGETLFAIAETKSHALSIRIHWNILA